ncbi:methanol dehydrogenase [Salinisphaera orenii MK-B5]|uniref:Methanol dehydrogenase n=2 Tax=Salinisphaera orenii TaxID=856731 RepID=A0A423PFV4_9GAMM|nr:MULTISPECIES: methanol dehydrogenase [cytochrome c] subunit [Salinisphaera]ROO24487.1 methanol dehydrogenase [Salinisphaera orenii MK-B5]ROO27891.1 methanol dehydrogenase [Salinisphaera halophila YIM 95161]
MRNRRIIIGATLVAAGGLLGTGTALGYDGTNCEEPGMCWEPKPGYPEKIEGSKYDPKHSESELNKQQESIRGMEKRNAMRVKHFKETGDWVYDTDELELQQAMDEEQSSS